MDIPTLTAINPEFNTPADGVGFVIPSHHVQQTVTQIFASWASKVTAVME